MKANQCPFPVLLLVQFHWAAISVFSLVIQISGVFCPFAGCHGYRGTAQPGALRILPWRTDSLEWCSAASGRDRWCWIAVWDCNADSVMHCRAQQSKHDSLFFKQGSTQAAVSRSEYDTRRFSTFSKGRGKQREEAIPCHWCSACYKATRRWGREVLLHLCMGVNGCAPWNHTDSSFFLLLWSAYRWSLSESSH